MESKLTHVILLLACLLSAALSLGAQNTSTQERRKAALEKEIAQLERQIQDNATRSSNALGELTLIRKKLSTRRELLSDSEREIRVISDSIKRADRAARELSLRIDEMSEDYGELLQAAYRNRKPEVWYIYLLASEDIAQAGRRYSYLRNIAGQMNSEGRRIMEAKSKLDSSLVALGLMKRKAEDLRAKRKKELEALQADEKRSDDVIAKLQKDKRSYQRQLDEKRRQVEALNKEIERIIAEYMAQAEKSKTGGGSNDKKPREIDYKLSAKFENNMGKLPWPADGPVVEGFGKHYHPVYTGVELPFNNGINIALSEGDEVRSVFDGEVRSIIVMPGYNKCVLVQHGSYFTFYCKLDEVAVKAYDKVKTGQLIGKVGTIDGQTQLHFQVLKERTPQDPEKWLRPYR